MNTTHGETNFWKEIYTRTEDKIESDPKNEEVDKSPFRYWTLVTALILNFFNTYIIQGAFLQGRIGYYNSIHRAVLLFADNVTKYEIIAVQQNRNNQLNEIKKEWS